MYAVLCHGADESGQTRIQNEILVPVHRHIIYIRGVEHDRPAFARGRRGNCPDRLVYRDILRIRIFGHPGVRGRSVDAGDSGSAASVDETARSSGGADDRSCGAHPRFPVHRVHLLY